MKKNGSIIVFAMFSLLLASLFVGCGDSGPGYLVTGVLFNAGDNDSNSTAGGTAAMGKTVSAMISSTAGGTVVMSNSDISAADLKVVIPAGALSKAETVTIKRLDQEAIAASEFKSQIPSDIVSPVYDLRSDSNFFSKDITIEIPFLLSKLAASYDPRKLELIYFQNGNWHEVDSYTIDDQQRKIVANLNHFTAFVIVYNFSASTTPDSFAVSGINLTPETPTVNDSIYIALSAKVTTGSQATIKGYYCSVDNPNIYIYQTSGLILLPYKLSQGTHTIWAQAIDSNGMISAVVSKNVYVKP